MTQPPRNPAIYHIIHVDRLPSIIAEGGLRSDAEVRRREMPGTSIGAENIKERRLSSELTSHSGLHVGACVPFYFAPRSVMLYMFSVYSKKIEYRGGQEPIVHLKADFHETVAWARRQNQRWAFTTSNAGSHYFEDHCDPNDLNKVDWDAVGAKYWKEVIERKQAEFLLERFFPWELVSHIGVNTLDIQRIAEESVANATHQPDVERRPEWYY